MNVDLLINVARAGGVELTAERAAAALPLVMSMIAADAELRALSLTEPPSPPDGPA